MENHISLDEASRLLEISVGTLWSWRNRGLIWPASRALNPHTNRMMNVYDLDELTAVKTRLAARHAPGR